MWCYIYSWSCYSINMPFIQSNIVIRANRSADIADFGLTEFGGSTFATSFHERGTIRCMSPELLDIRTPGNAPTTRNDVYSFGSLMLQVCSALHQSEPQSLRYMTRRTGSDWKCALPLLYASRACSLERDNADTAWRCAGR